MTSALQLAPQTAQTPSRVKPTFNFSKLNCVFLNANFLPSISNTMSTVKSVFPKLPYAVPLHLISSLKADLITAPTFLKNPVSVVCKKENTFDQNPVLMPMSIMVVSTSKPFMLNVKWDSLSSSSMLSKFTCLNFAWPKLTPSTFGKGIVCSCSNFTNRGFMCSRSPRKNIILRMLATFLNVDNLQDRFTCKKVLSREGLSVEGWPTPLGTYTDGSAFLLKSFLLEPEV